MEPDRSRRKVAMERATEVLKGATERATESGKLTDHPLAARSAGARRDLASRTPVANNNGVELSSLYM